MRVRPCRLPAKVMVAPNSPSDRANASTAPETSPGSTSGTVIRRNTVVGRSAQRGGDDLVAVAGRAQRALEADDEERQRDERLGHHHRDGREGDLDARGRRATRRAARGGRRCRAARARRRPAAAPAAAAPASAAPRGTGSPSARAPAPAARRSTMQASVLATDVRRLSHSAAWESSEVTSVQKLRPLDLGDDRDEGEQDERRAEQQRARRPSEAGRPAADASPAHASFVAGAKPAASRIVWPVSLNTRSTNSWARSPSAASASAAIG